MAELSPDEVRRLRLMKFAPKATPEAEAPAIEAVADPPQEGPEAEVPAIEAVADPPQEGPEAEVPVVEGVADPPQEGPEAEVPVVKAVADPPQAASGDSEVEVAVVEAADRVQDQPVVNLQTRSVHDGFGVGSPVFICINAGDFTGMLQTCMQAMMRQALPALLPPLYQQQPPASEPWSSFGAAAFPRPPPPDSQAGPFYGAATSARPPPPDSQAGPSHGAATSARPPPPDSQARPSHGAATSGRPPPPDSQAGPSHGAATSARPHPSDSQPGASYGRATSARPQSSDSQLRPSFDAGPSSAWTAVNVSPRGSISPDLFAFTPDPDERLDRFAFTPEPDERPDRFAFTPEPYDLPDQFSSTPEPKPSAPARVEDVYVVSDDPSEPEPYEPNRDANGVMYYTQTRQGLVPHVVNETSKKKRPQRSLLALSKKKPKYIDSDEGEENEDGQYFIHTDQGLVPVVYHETKKGNRPLSKCKVQAKEDSDPDEPSHNPKNGCKVERKRGRPKGSKNKPKPKEFKNNGKCKKKQEGSDSDNEDRHGCKICKENNDKALVCTTCGHLFHKDCLDRWLEVSSQTYKTKKKCPFCNSFFEKYFKFFG